ncbi:hypothetical protein D0860_08307 [Hortaea werneckii]|uniref:Uncharacterized protein n=1 Tax=Hortaea werneckii TaxID=91943 RepID=A0A3M7GFC7_HORWE|nr:hypothetical protein D0860_08307 [Hortaea werneckii]
MRYQHFGDINTSADVHVPIDVAMQHSMSQRISLREGKELSEQASAQSQLVRSFLSMSKTVQAVITMKEAISYSRSNEMKESSLDEREASTLLPSVSKPRLTRRFQAAIVAAYIVVFVLLLINTALLLRARSDSRLVNKEWSDCGNNPQEARDRGCKFDITNFSWQHEPCFDQELTDEFVSTMEFRFFKEENQTTEVSFDEALQGELDLWVPWELHMQHCLYAWRQMHRSIGSSSRQLNSQLLDFNHTMHCGMMLMRRDREMKGINTKVLVNYPACQI